MHIFCLDLRRYELRDDRNQEVRRSERHLERLKEELTHSLTFGNSTSAAALAEPFGSASTAHKHVYESNATQQAFPTVTIHQRMQSSSPPPPPPLNHYHRNRKQEQRKLSMVGPYLTVTDDEERANLFHNLLSKLRQDLRHDIYQATLEAVNVARNEALHTKDDLYLTHLYTQL